MTRTTQVNNNTTITGISGKKYDYNLFKDIMSAELFQYAVSCNEYLEEQDRRKREGQLPAAM